LSIVALLVMAGSAGAQPPTPPTPEQRAARFVAADADKDGNLSKVEFTAALPERRKARVDTLWPTVDSNGDGKLTKEEFLAMPTGRAGRAQ
jgi:Ca2+-binding EF-hand superfamily protein